MSIQELCPKDFSSDVWSVLTEGHLQGISPLISQPKMNSERQLEIVSSCFTFGNEECVSVFEDNSKTRTSSQ